MRERRRQPSRAASLPMEAAPEPTPWVASAWMCPVQPGSHPASAGGFPKRQSENSSLGGAPRSACVGRTHLVGFQPVLEQLKALRRPAGQKRAWLCTERPKSPNCTTLVIRNLWVSLQGRCLMGTRQPGSEGEEQKSLFLWLLISSAPPLTHTPTHTATHTPRHTHTQQHTPTLTPTHTNTHTNTHLNTHLATHRATHTPTYANTDTHQHTHSNTATPPQHTHTPTYIHTNTQTHTH